MKDAVVQRRINTSVFMIPVLLLLLLVAGCGNIAEMGKGGDGSSATSPKGDFPARYGIFTSGKYGFIDETGTIVIKPQFDSVGGFFSEGCCAVKSNDKWGYIDCAGDFIVNPQYEEAYEFSEGLALIKKDGKYGYIDNKGGVIISPQYVDAGYFFDGMASVLIEKKWGFIDKTGKFVIDPEYSWAGNFQEGLTAVEFGERYGFIDANDQYVINPQYYDAGTFSEGLAWFKGTESADYGYIDKTGTTIINPQFDKAGGFSEGLARVGIGFKWGYIDPTGKMAINPTYEDADDFSEGLAGVQLGNKWGFIDKEGQYVINPQYDLVNPFQNGLALIMKDTGSEDTFTIGYIDATGKSIWSLEIKESDLPPDLLSTDSAATEDTDSLWDEPIDTTATGDSLSTVPASNAVWNISASSILQPGATTAYDPELIMDYDAGTAWVEGKADDGIGEWIMFSLPYGQTTSIYEIDIYNGYQKSEELYYANNRAKKIQIDYSDGTSEIADLDDYSFGSAQTVYAIGENIDSVKITILEVYPGNKYSDTCIAEVNFD